MKEKVYVLGECEFAKAHSNARQCFWEGLLPIFDLGGTLLDDIYVFRTGYEEDIAALRGDWIVIGQDIHDAITSFPDCKAFEHLTYERNRKG